MYRWGRGLGQLLCQQYLLPMVIISWEEAQVEGAGLYDQSSGERAFDPGGWGDGSCHGLWGQG